MSRHSFLPNNYKIWNKDKKNRIQLLELIYLNASRQIQNERGLGFICKISGLPCQEQALLKCFWSLIFDNLTMSDQNNPFELTALQNNWNCFRIKSNFTLNERFCSATLRLESNCAHFVPVPLESDIGINEWLLIMKSLPDSSLIAASV